MKNRAHWRGLFMLVINTVALAITLRTIWGFSHNLVRAVTGEYGSTLAIVEIASCILIALTIVVSVWFSFKLLGDSLPMILLTLSVRHAVRVKRIPGSRIRSVLNWVYSKKTMQRVFDPTLADMQNEWLEAIIEGKKWKARWIRLRGTYSIFSAMGLHVLVSAGKKLLSIWKVG